MPTFFKMKMAADVCHGVYPQSKKYRSQGYGHGEGNHQVLLEIALLFKVGDHSGRRRQGKGVAEQETMLLQPHRDPSSSIPTD